MNEAAGVLPIAISYVLGQLLISPLSNLRPLSSGEALSALWNERLRFDRADERNDRIIHAGLLSTRVITLSRPNYWSKPLLIPLWLVPKLGEYTFSFSLKVRKVYTTIRGGRGRGESPATAPIVAGNRPLAEV